MWSNFIKSLYTAFELLIKPNSMLTEIVSTTMFMALNSTLWSSIIGLIIGCIVAYKEFKGKKVVVTVMRTFMGLPPVAVGIVLYLLFSGTGPFGSLGLIYSVKLMIIAQIVLITPVVAGMTENVLSPVSQSIRDSAIGLNIKPLKRMVLIINEGKMQILSAIMFAFARATAEVGAVQIVGGNILHSTRVMTTSIMMNYNTGSFELAIALGIILLLITLIINIFATLLSTTLKRK